MPIIHFINNKTQTSGGLKTVLAYISKDEKVSHNSRKYITALNSSEPTAYDEFNATKNLFHKNDGRQYYHAVQSFPKGYEISYELAHKIAVEFAEKAFGNYECIVATHTDRDHVHSHFVFNSVSFQYGKKYHSNLKSVQELMNLSDEICRKYGVPVLDEADFSTAHPAKDTISDREFRSAQKGESQKFILINVITQIMKQAKTKKQFCYLMQQQGYGVVWEDNRKYITYTCPDGKKFRDKRLHEEKFRKEMMELEFEIRRTETDVLQTTGTGGGHASGNTGTGFQLESSAGTQSADVHDTDSNSQYTVGSDAQGRYGQVPSGTSQRTTSYTPPVQNDSGNHSGTDTISHSSADTTESETILTGWESEREVFLSAERIRRKRTQEQKEMASSNPDFASVLDGVIRDISDVVTLIDEPEPDTSKSNEDHTDSKRFAEERRRKEQLGIHI